MYVIHCNWPIINMGVTYLYASFNELTHGGLGTPYVTADLD